MEIHLGDSIYTAFYDSKTNLVKIYHKGRCIQNYKPEMPCISLKEVKKHLWQIR